MLQFQYVNFTYSSQLQVLRNLDFEVKQGETFVILGPSGCGKSTVLSLAAGFLLPTSGRVLLNGEAIGGPGKDRLVVFQGDDSLLAWKTALENVTFGLELLKWRQADISRVANQFLEVVGLKDHANKFPHQLSGGMKQRIQIARALAPGSPILLMDEPFGALDAQTRGVLQELFASIVQVDVRTVLFITHDIAEALILADKVCVMTKGPSATVREVIDIDLPRPRRRSTLRFGELYEHLNGLLHDAMPIQ